MPGLQYSPGALEGTYVSTRSIGTLVGLVGRNHNIPKIICVTRVRFAKVNFGNSSSR